VGTFDADTAFYVSVSSTDYCENLINTRLKVNIFAKPISVAANIFIDDEEVCEGDNTTLSPDTDITGENVTYRWYTSQTATNFFYEGATYTTPNLFANVTYYIGVFSDDYCENNANTRKPVVLTVRRVSTVPEIDNDQPKCLGETLTFTVTNTESFSPNAIYTWYEVERPDVAVGTGVSFSTTVPGFYFVIASEGGCKSPESEPLEAFFGEFPTLTWEGEPTIEVRGSTATIEGVITNIGLTDMLPPVSVTFYKAAIDPANIMDVQELDFVIEVGESYPITLVLTNWSDFTPIPGIWVSINDNNGVYPEQKECDPDGRIYIDRPCPPTVDDNEDHTYKVTPLAGLCWTSNLQSRLYFSGEEIAFANPYNSTQYPDVVYNEEIFGLLYTWTSAVGMPEGSTDMYRGLVVQGICPDGWHIPAQWELDLLSTFPAADIKSENYWITPGNDKYGFEARPAGRYSSATGKYEDLYGFTGYWSSNGNGNGTTASYFSISYYCPMPETLNIKRADGLSVRCIMD
jgi:uncharacterized protein (TIGR02145 family)